MSSPILRSVIATSLEAISFMINGSVLGTINRVEFVRKSIIHTPALVAAVYNIRVKNTHNAVTNASNLARCICICMYL